MKRVGTSLLLSTQAITAAGSTQADATPIGTAPIGLIVVAGADGTVGILLPPAVEGKSFTIKNNAAAVLKVWPAGTNQVNAITAGSAISMASLTCATFTVGPNGNTWYTNPLLPS
jgi:hypothetical protein